MPCRALLANEEVDIQISGALIQRTDLGASGSASGLSDAQAAQLSDIQAKVTKLVQLISPNS